MQGVDFLSNIKGETPLDVVLSVAKNQIIEELTLMQFSSNIKALSEIERLVKNGRIKKVNIFLNNGVEKRNRQGYLASKRVADLCNTKIKVGNTHVKIILIELENDGIVIDSSSNINSNSKWEMTQIFNNIDVLRGFKEYAEKYFK